MIKIITIKEAALELKFKDIRSVIRWANKNKIKIFSEENGRKKYMIRSQFEYVRLKKVIEYLKLKYKGEWLEAFKVYGSMNLLDVIEIEEGRKIKSLKEYNPQGEHERKFLNNIGLDN